MKRVIIASALLGLSVAGVVSAQDYQLSHRGGDYQKHHGYGERKQAHMERIFKKLEVTEAQQLQVKAIMQSMHDENRALREQIRDNKQALGELMGAENLDQSKLRQLAQDTAELKVQSMINRHSAHQRMEAVAQ